MVSQTPRDVRLGETSTAVAESGTPPALRGRPAELRRIAIVPAYNEEATVGAVIDEIRAAAPGFDVVVIDDGSIDRTAAVAEAHGAVVLRLPYNVGIGAAVQTGHQYAAEHGFDIAIQVDGDGQHDPSEITKLVEPLLAGEVDMVVGTRFVEDDGYRSSALRRVGIAVLSRVVSVIVRQRVTDPTSGFRAVNRRTLELFAADYPHDYPEAEATVLVAPPPAADDGGLCADARARRGPVVYPWPLLARLHGESARGPLRRSVPPLPARAPMTPLRVSLLAAAAALFLLLVVFELIRRRRLQERYALLWIVTGTVILVLALWRQALTRFADLVGIAYPPSALFILASFFILVLLLHYSTVISKLSAQNIRLAQRVALLEQELRKRRGERDAPPAAP